MKYFFAFLFFLFIRLIAPAVALSEEDAVARIYSHLIVKDYSSALKEGGEALHHHSLSKKVWQAYFEAIAMAGDEKSLLAFWALLSEKFPEEKENRGLLESMAWCVLRNGATSHSPLIRTMALLGGFFSHDCKGIDILLRSLKDPNSFIRAAAIKLSSEMKDAPLCEKLVELFNTETVWNVRLEAIKAMGVIQNHRALPALKKIISQENHPQEKVAAIQAMISLSKSVSREELKVMIQSPRAGFRLLACELVNHFELIDDLDQLLPLLEDSHAEVRCGVMRTLGLLRADRLPGLSIQPTIVKRTEDTDPSSAVTAAWLLTLYDPERGQSAFRRFLNHSDRDIRLLAAAALSATGMYGMDLQCEYFLASKDIYVRMNLALGLITQRQQVAKACDCLYQGLMMEEKLMWDKEHFFEVLSPSRLSYDALIPNYPEFQNQLVRLEILNLLAIMNYPKAQEGARAFLKKRAWGVSGTASSLLLTEGDESEIALVEGLLTDSNKTVRIQAALILSLWGRGEKAIQVLQEEYSKSDREMKERILEGIAKIGSYSSLPFLVERLKEPHQSLRIIAAAGIIASLYK